MTGICSAGIYTVDVRRQLGDSGRKTNVAAHRGGAQTVATRSQDRMSDSADRRPRESHHVAPLQLGGATPTPTPPTKPTPPRPRSSPRRPKALRVIDPAWRDNLPSFVPQTWRPRGDVPATRGDCPSDRSTCAHVRCRHHLWLVETRDRPGRRSSPREPDGTFMRRDRFSSRSMVDARATPPASILRPATPTACALAVVSAHPTGLGYAAIGALFGITGERCGQIARTALAKLARHGVELGVELGEVLP